MFLILDLEKMMLYFNKQVFYAKREYHISNKILIFFKLNINNGKKIYSSNLL